MTVTQKQFREALGRFATGVTIITVALDGGEVHGMTANAFSSVSLDPLLVLVCVHQDARTHGMLYKKKRFGINVLAENQQQLSEYCARATEQQEPSEANARFTTTLHGTPVLEGALAYLECRLQSATAAGDHTIFIAEVEEFMVRQGEPLLFFSGKYRKLGPVLGGAEEKSKNI